jgi:amino acid transporter
MKLHRRFSALTLLLISINGMIGSAWLFAPLYAAKIAGPGVMISWLLGGVMTLLIAFTFAELSAMLPVAGGMMRFPQLSHGTLTNLTISWLAWLSCATMPPIEVQAMLQYAGTYFPKLIYLANGTPLLTHVGLVWAMLLMALFAILNIASYSGLIRFNFALFVFKIGVIFCTIFALAHTHFITHNFVGIFPSGNHAQYWSNVLSALAGGGVAFAFTGFTHGVALAAEAKNSRFTIPFAVIGCIVCCLLIYLGLQIVFIGALNPHQLQHGWSHLSFAGEMGPFVGLAGLLGLALLAKLLYTDAMVSPFGAGFIYTTSTARMVYALSKNGFFPPLFARLNKKGFPAMAVLLNFALGMFLFLPLPGWQTMVSFLVSSIVIAYAMGPIALVCLRMQLPHEDRPFRLPFANALCLLAFYCCNLICYWTGWATLSKLAIAMVIGAIALIIAYRRGMIDKKQFGFSSIYWLAPYLLGLVTISYVGSFGGKNIIPFGWDFVVIAFFSAVIFKLAIMTRLGAVNEQFGFYKAEAQIETIV